MISKTIFNLGLLWLMICFTFQPSPTETPQFLTDRPRVLEVQTFLALTLVVALSNFQKCRKCLDSRNRRATLWWRPLTCSTRPSQVRGSPESQVLACQTYLAYLEMERMDRAPVVICWGRCAAWCHLESLEKVLFGRTWHGRETVFNEFPPNSSINSRKLFPSCSPFQAPQNYGFFGELSWTVSGSDCDVSSKLSLFSWRNLRCPNMDGSHIISSYTTFSRWLGATVLWFQETKLDSDSVPETNAVSPEANAICLWLEVAGNQHSRMHLGLRCFFGIALEGFESFLFVSPPVVSNSNSLHCLFCTCIFLFVGVNFPDILENAVQLTQTFVHSLKTTAG